MRLLWIATKSPEPAVDGGRLVTKMTLEALAQEGVAIDVIAPAVEPRPPSPEETGWPGGCRPHLVEAQRAGLAKAFGAVRRPVSIARHSHRAVLRRVIELLDSREYDAVHVEQVQAFAHAEPALDRGLRVVLRAQNVESELWRRSGWWLRWEARRLAAFEGRAVRRAGAAAALSNRDARHLSELAGGTEVVTVPPPFPSTLAPGPTLAGNPPLVLMGSGGWRPNREASRWFLTQAWSVVSAQVPAAVLHLFAPESERPPVPAGVVAHAPPPESRTAFPAGGILLVPLWVGSGVRMKILEAWARGVCVVAMPEAVAGLDAEDGRDVLLARDAGEFAGAVQRLVKAQDLRRSLVQGGRETLTRRHDPAVIAKRLIDLYRGSP